MMILHTFHLKPFLADVTCLYYRASLFIIHNMVVIIQ